MKEFGEIINRHLDGRGAFPDGFQTHEVHRVPVYVVKMLDELLTAVQRTNPDATFKELLSWEQSASGHVDYHAKLSLYAKWLSDPARPQAGKEGR